MSEPKLHVTDAFGDTFSIKDESGQPLAYTWPARNIESYQPDKMRAFAHLIAAAPDLYEVAKRYEAWEAKLLETSAAWGSGLPIFTQELYDDWIAIQTLCNAALAKADGEKEVKA